MKLADKQHEKLCWLFTIELKNKKKSFKDIFTIQDRSNFSEHTIPNLVTSKIEVTFV